MPNKPLTNKQKQADFRAAKNAKGLKEIRGIWARPEMHAALKLKIKALIEAAKP